MKPFDGDYVEKIKEERDSIITPDNTRLIAEWMGEKFTYQTVMSEINTIFVTDEGRDIEYSLTNNADQRFEVLEKLLGLGYGLLLNEDTYRLKNFDPWSVDYAETLKLAIYKTALSEAKKNG